MRSLVEFSIALLRFDLVQVLSLDIQFSIAAVKAYIGEYITV